MGEKERRIDILVAAATASEAFVMPSLTYALACDAIVPAAAVAAVPAASPALEAAEPAASPALAAAVPTATPALAAEEPAFSAPFTMEL